MLTNALRERDVALVCRISKDPISGLKEPSRLVSATAGFSTTTKSVPALLSGLPTFDRNPPLRRDFLDHESAEYRTDLNVNCRFDSKLYAVLTEKQGLHNLGENVIVGDVQGGLNDQRLDEQHVWSVGGGIFPGGIGGLPCMQIKIPKFLSMIVYIGISSDPGNIDWEVHFLWQGNERSDNS